MLFAKYDIQSELVKNNFGIVEPKDKEFVDIEAIDIALIPCVAFNDKLFRLGMGGGFYDRTLAFKARNSHPAPRLVGLAHSFQEIAGISTGPWDIPIDHVITEKDVISTSSST